MPVEDEKVKAKDGYTRVYVELNAEVQRYLDELPKRFLHFSGRPAQVKQSFLPKADRNLNGKRDGRDLPGRRLVREIEESDEDSVYDYNFKQAELQIDECRNSSDYAIKAAIAKLYRKASGPELVPVFKALVDQKPTFEATLDPYYICPSWETPKPSSRRTGSRRGRPWPATRSCAAHPPPWPSSWRGRAYAAEVHQGRHRDGRGPLRRQDGRPGAHGEREARAARSCPPRDAAMEAVDTVWGWLVNMQHDQRQGEAGWSGASGT